MGYVETNGIILGRRDLFEDDQEIHLLTPSHGGLEVRAPHARRSQKTFCGRLEPPNRVDVRLYQARENARWTLSSVSIEEVFADLLRDGSLRYRLWPLMGLYRDLYPEGDRPGEVLPRIRTGLRLLKGGFRPALLVVVRLLIFTAERTGIGLPVAGCRECQRPVTPDSTGPWTLMLARGPTCPDCSTESGERDRTVSPDQLLLYGHLRDRPWKEVRGLNGKGEALRRLESLLYRLFHYHFEVSLDVLEVRRKL